MTSSSRVRITASSSAREASRRAPHRSAKPSCGRPAQPAPRRPQARVASLDGLRTLAVVAIVLYHANCPWLPSGHMGVVMFLVLTGYLFTVSLLRRLRARRYSLAAIGRRRFLRVWPSMAAMVVALTALCVVANHVLLTKLRPDIVPSLLFFDNWHYIASGQSYFDAIGSPSPLTPLWYVSLDAQLCLMWAAAVWLAAKLAPRRSLAWIRRLALLGALASLAAMALLYNPAADPSRVYYGTDTRAFSFLAGAWLAVVWPPNLAASKAQGFTFASRLLPLLKARGASGASAAEKPAASRTAAQPQAVRVSRQAMQGASLGALAFLALVMVLVPADAPFFYWGGMGLVTVAACVLLGALVVPGLWVTRLFGLPAAAWVGERSYGLYLWHYPLLLLIGGNLAKGQLAQFVAAVGVACGAAMLSFRFIERPFQSGALVARLADARHRKAVMAALVVVGVAAVGLALVPETYLVPQEAIKSTGDAADAAVDTSKIDRSEAAGGEAAQGEAADPSAQLPQEPFSLAAGAQEIQNGAFAPLLIGDSVPGDSPFNLWFPSGFMDAYIGRHPSQALRVLKGYVEQGALSDCLVLATFSNSTAKPEQLDEMVAAAGENVQIYLVGTVNSDGFQDEQNANLQACAAKYDNVAYVDWPSAVAGHEQEYLWGDGTHLRPEGARAYLDTISRAVAPQMIAEGAAVTPLTPEEMTRAGA